MKDLPSKIYIVVDWDNRDEVVGVFYNKENAEKLEKSSHYHSMREYDIEDWKENSLIS